MANKLNGLKQALKQMFSSRIENRMTNNSMCFVVTLGYTGLYCCSILSREEGLIFQDSQPFFDSLLPTIITFVACVIFQNISLKDERSNFSFTGWTLVVTFLYSCYTLMWGTISSIFNLLMLCAGAFLIVFLAFVSIYQLSSLDSVFPCDTGIVAAKPTGGKRKGKV